MAISQTEAALTPSALSRSSRAARAGIGQHQLGYGLAMAYQHDALAGRNTGQQAREVRLGLLDVDPARREAWRSQLPQAGRPGDSTTEMGWMG